MTCDHCGVPDRTEVLRAMSWWTPATLRATVHKMGGRFTDETDTHIYLPWKFKPDMEPSMACFPKEICSWRGINLRRCGDKKLCGYCAAQAIRGKDGRFQ